LVVVAALGCWILLAVCNGAEQVDSGWAVAIPSPLAKGPAPVNLEQELVIRHVLEQTRQPLLRKTPSPQVVASGSEQSAALRFAERPETAPDGWRPAAQPIEAAAKVSPNPAADEECDYTGDCSGAPDHATAAPQPAPAGLGDVAPNSSTPPVGLDASSAAPADGDGPLVIGQNPAAEPIVGAQGQITEDDASSQPPENESDPPPRMGAESEPQAAATAPPANGPTNDTAPASDMPPLSKQLVSLRTRVRAVLKGYYRKPLNSRDNDPWEAMHGMLANGVHSRIRSGGPNGELITSVGWLCYNKPCKRQTMLYVTPSGELRAKYGVGLQGHLGQFLAMLAQCRVSPDYPIHVGDHEFTIHDLIEAEKKTCYPKSELTFKLIALQHYADLNDKWENDQGVQWDFPRLIREELAQPIRGAACGGTHRLSGLSLAVKTRLRRGEPLDGEYLRAAEFVKKYQMYAFRLQNRDGSLSTSWFRGAGDEDDIDRRIKTTGHILEWLCYSLSDAELRDQRTIRAVTYLANLMYGNYDHDWEVGPRSHATHALLLYDERVFRPYDKEGEIAVYRPTPSVAKRNSSGNSRR
jgi:hypothetical protein